MKNSGSFNHTQSSTVGILGAGIMGCCLALELAQRGYKVDLIDLAKEPVTSASLHNEGKLHLGFVYANDPSNKTHETMLRGALAFGSILEKLTGRKPAAFMNPEPFHYFVPVSSKLTMARLESHFETVEAYARKLANITGDQYLGLKPNCYFRKNTSREHEQLFSPRSTLGSFRTEERSVSPQAVAEILRHAIDIQPNISFFGESTIHQVDRRFDGRVDVDISREQVTSKLRYPCVVNCLWDDKIRVDQTAGVEDPDKWIYRFKVAIKFSLPSGHGFGIPSATGIHGPYGDVVKLSNGMYYLSWYPLCKIEQCTTTEGRILHDRVHKGWRARGLRRMTADRPKLASFVSSHAHKKFIKDNIRQMSEYIPSLTDLNRFAHSVKLGGGVIMARGYNDIDNSNSQLHQRLPVGPEAHGSYVTVDTGKYTMAPLFSSQAADLVTEILN